MPLYFHLLSDKEVDRLKVVLRVVQENREGVLDHWYELYTLHFAHERTFSQAEFKEFFGADLDAVTRTLLDHDIVALARSVREVGEQLLERGVPFEEIIASMHLFEESCGIFFRRNLSVLAKGPDIMLIFDKLSHVRMIILAEVYFGAYRALQETRTRALEQDLQRLDPEATQRQSFHGLVGASPAMRRLYERIQAAAPTGASILIAGESGTGKEVLARAIHEVGAPATAPFIALNCAALPRELIESELFGHRKGAFSGATGEYLGLVRAAEGGTLFLDEITEMPSETQAKLLRALQERTVRPVGSTSEIPVDVRFIASTNRPVREAVAEGRMREDLYYRLKVHTLELPPLRERPEDVALFVEHFIQLFNQRYPREVKGVEEAALQALTRYDWPGTVRELMNAIEVAFAYGRTDHIRLEDLPSEISGRKELVQPGVDNGGSVFDALSPIPTFEESERILLERALDATNGNKLRAAKMLGISRKQLYAKIKKYSIELAEE
ncbi:MAG: sigma-54-dependent Fis family transcriptional regulator [Candidatus Latescibacterota bacterium]|nr:MAG: sigma-54-dependent Fis family transcriptional regulator [Candidatus Latescibacterota bacterium]